MGTGLIVIGCIASLVAVFGLSFTVFWSIIKNMETRLCQKIDGFERIVSGHEEKFGSLFKAISTKEESKYCEATYVRKREHELEFALLKEKMDSIQKDLTKIIENGKGEKR